MKDCSAVLFHLHYYAGYKMLHLLELVYFYVLNVVYILSQYFVNAIQSHIQM